MSYFQRDQKHFWVETQMEVWVLKCCISYKHSCSHRLPRASLQHVPPASEGRRSCRFHQEEQLQTDNCKQPVCGQRLSSFLLTSGPGTAGLVLVFSITVISKSNTVSGEQDRAPGKAVFQICYRLVGDGEVLSSSFRHWGLSGSPARVLAPITGSLPCPPPLGTGV